ncbi:MAG: hypothetical protein JNG86_11045, partial [Verrucomicrobiaceae bacterium]|nr:hypothetical protein [Verrucomicrobiaceae bacterium]
MKLTRLAAFLIALTSPFSMAGEAFFSQDGRTVTMGLSRALTGLVEVNIVTGKITHAPLPKELKDVPIESVARGAEGEALFLAKDAVWVWNNESTPPVKRVCATAPVVNAADLFVVTQPGTPLTDCLFVSNGGTGGFEGRKPGAKTFSS